MAFEHRVTARFHEVDRAGIVFFGRAFEYAHVCFEEMLAAAFGEVATVFDRHGFGMPLVHAEADYSAPTRQGDRLIVRLTVERASERSVTFAYAIVGEDGRLRVTVRLVHAFVDFADFRKLPMPAAFREGLRRLDLLPDG
jgi:YbgC/YbaW family acyl-CoA thioester hydrolase